MLRRTLAALAAAAALALPAQAANSPPGLQARNALSEIAGLGGSIQGTARGNLGLGTIATQGAGAVAITGGNVDGTPIGATTPAAMTGTVLKGGGSAASSSTSSIYTSLAGTGQWSFGWNFANGSGETDLFINRGNGTGGGFYVYDVSGSGTLTSIMSVTGSGSLFLPGNLSTGGLTYRSTASGVSAAGTTQATATALTLELNVITTAASGSGVVLAVGLGGSRQAQQQVWNRGANALLVYPASGAQIEAGGANAAVSIATGGHATFTCTSATQCYQSP